MAQAMKFVLGLLLVTALSSSGESHAIAFYQTQRFHQLVWFMFKDRSLGSLLEAAM